MHPPSGSPRSFCLNELLSIKSGVSIEFDVGVRLTIADIIAGAVDDFVVDDD